MLNLNLSFTYLSALRLGQFLDMACCSKTTLTCAVLFSLFPGHPVFSSHLQGQAEWSFKKPGIEESVPAHGRKVGIT